MLWPGGIEDPWSVGSEYLCSEGLSPHSPGVVTDHNLRALCIYILSGLSTCSLSASSIHSLSGLRIHSLWALSNPSHRLRVLTVAC